MTKADIVDRVASATGITKIDTRVIVDGFLNSVVEAISQNKTIELRGFGTFKVVKRAQRTGRNPRTGEQVKIPERYMPVFKPSKELKNRLLTTQV